MLLYKSGGKLPPKSLGRILRHHWAELQESVAERIDRRKKSGVPLDDGEGHTLMPLGEYPYQAELDSVLVGFRVLALFEVRESQMRLVDCAPPDDAGAEESIAAVKAASNIKRDFIKRSIYSLTGLEDEGGPLVVAEGGPSHEQAILLEDSGLLDYLWTAGQHVHELTGDERKNCGALQQQTSSTSTATPVPSPCEGSEGASAEVECSTTLEPNSKQEPARGESSLDIHGSAESLSSTLPPEMPG